MGIHNFPLSLAASAAILAIIVAIVFAVAAEYDLWDDSPGDDA